MLLGSGCFRDVMMDKNHSELPGVFLKFTFFSALYSLVASFKGRQTHQCGHKRKILVYHNPDLIFVVLTLFSPITLPRVVLIKIPVWEMPPMLAKMLVWAFASTFLCTKCPVSRNLKAPKWD